MTNKNIGVIIGQVLHVPLISSVFLHLRHPYAGQKLNVLQE